MLNIRYEPPDESAPCPCGCGARQVALTRFIDEEGEPRAVCFARFTTNHAERVAAASVSVGAFGEGSTPADRVAFAIQIRPREEGYRLAVLDAAQSPWNDVELIGRTLDRDEAVAHPMFPLVQQIIGGVLEHDVPLRTYLEAAE